MSRISKLILVLALNVGLANSGTALASDFQPSANSLSWESAQKAGSAIYQYVISNPLKVTLGFAGGFLIFLGTRFTHAHPHTRARVARAVVFAAYQAQDVAISFANDGIPANLVVSAGEDMRQFGNMVPELYQILNIKRGSTSIRLPSFVLLSASIRTLSLSLINRCIFENPDSFESFLNDAKAFIATLTEEQFLALGKTPFFQG